MTPEEMKTMLDNNAANSAAAKSAAEALSAKQSEQDKSITNLDHSVKEMDEKIKTCQAKLSREDIPASVKAFVGQRLNEKAAEIKKAWESGSRTGVTIPLFEMKTAAADMGTGNVSPNYFLGVAVDSTISAEPLPANSFIAAFGQRPCVGNTLGWVDATRNAANTVGYVDELALNTNQSDYAFATKTREYGKIVTKIALSTEMSDWLSVVYDWCLNDAMTLVEAKFDNEIFNGAGDDSSHPNYVYGLKAAATAFSVLSAGQVEKANVADVIADARMQIAKGGFNANVAFVTWADYANLRTIKTTEGNYIYNEALGMLNGIRILPTTRLTTGELLVVDTSCVAVYGGGNSYELEIVRAPDYDKNNIYFRKRCQVLVKNGNKKGLIYVANVTTAIAALQKSSGSVTGDSL